MTRHFVFGMTCHEILTVDRCDRNTYWCWNTTRSIWNDLPASMSIDLVEGISMLKSVIEKHITHIHSEALTCIIFHCDVLKYLTSDVRDRETQFPTKPADNAYRVPVESDFVLEGLANHLVGNRVWAYPAVDIADLRAAVIIVHFSCVGFAGHNTEKKTGSPGVEAPQTRQSCVCFFIPFVIFALRSLARVI